MFIMYYYLYVIIFKRLYFVFTAEVPYQMPTLPQKILPAAQPIDTVSQKTPMNAQQNPRPGIGQLKSQLGKYIRSLFCRYDHVCMYVETLETICVYNCILNIEPYV